MQNINWKYCNLIIFFFFSYSLSQILYTQAGFSESLNSITTKVLPFLRVANEKKNSDKMLTYNEKILKLFISKLVYSYRLDSAWKSACAGNLKS